MPVPRTHIPCIDSSSPELQEQKPPNCGYTPLMLLRKCVIQLVPPLWLLRLPEFRQQASRVIAIFGIHARQTSVH